jgi:hypothetical protein
MEEIGPSLYIYVDENWLREFVYSPTLFRLMYFVLLQIHSSNVDKIKGSLSRLPR